MPEPSRHVWPRSHIQPSCGRFIFSCLSQSHFVAKVSPQRDVHEYFLLGSQGFSLFLSFSASVMCWVHFSRFLLYSCAARRQTGDTSSPLSTALMWIARSSAAQAPAGACVVWTFAWSSS